MTEKIIKRIASLKKRIEQLQDRADNVTMRVSGAIKRHANNPAYIAEWLDSWMREPNNYNNKITKLQEEIEILEWVLEE